MGSNPTSDKRFANNNVFANLNLDASILVRRGSQDGRAVQGAALRSQSGSPAVGSIPTSDKLFANNNVFAKINLDASIWVRRSSQDGGAV